MPGTCTEKLLWVTGKRKSIPPIEKLCWAASTSFTALFGHKMTDVEANPIHPLSRQGKNKGLA